MFFSTSHVINANLLVLHLSSLSVFCLVFSQHLFPTTACTCTFSETRSALPTHYSTFNMSLYLCDIECILTFDDSELKIHLYSPATHYTSISLQQRREVLYYLLNHAMFHVFASYHQSKIDAIVFNVQILLSLIIMDDSVNIWPICDRIVLSQ